MRGRGHTIPFPHDGHSAPAVVMPLAPKRSAGAVASRGQRDSPAALSRIPPPRPPDLPRSILPRERAAIDPRGEGLRRARRDFAALRREDDPVERPGDGRGTAQDQPTATRDQGMRGNRRLVK
jgi:hypothetical protein